MLPCGFGCSTVDTVTELDLFTSFFLFDNTVVQISAFWKILILLESLVMKYIYLVLWKISEIDVTGFICSMTLS